MTEEDYVRICNLHRARVMEDMLREYIPYSKEEEEERALVGKIIRKWVDRGFVYADKKGRQEW